MCGVFYYNFGDKCGLMVVVVYQIDVEMVVEVWCIVESIVFGWFVFLVEGEVYIVMVLCFEVQCIVLLDGFVVLGDLLKWFSQDSCLYVICDVVDVLIVDGILLVLDFEVMVWMLMGVVLNVVLWVVVSDQFDFVLLCVVVVFW